MLRRIPEKIHLRDFDFDAVLNAAERHNDIVLGFAANRGKPKQDTWGRV